MVKVKRSERKRIKDEIEKVLEKMKDVEIGGSQYDGLLEQLERLKELDEWKLDLKTVVNNGVYIGGLLLVLHYEKLDVITSKAVGFMRKRA